MCVFIILDHCDPQCILALEPPTGTGNGYRLHRRGRVYTLAHLSLRKLLTRVPNVNERVRREVIYARTCTRVTRTLVQITSRRALTSESDRISGGFIPVSRERERQRRLPSKRPDWMTLNFRSCAPVTGIECRVCRTA